MLKAWRLARRFSQSGLATEAEVSARHLSFIETGRARPSAGIVYRVGRALDLPRDVHNHLMAAAGHTPLFVERPADDPDLRPIYTAAERMLTRHAPYPALMLDSSWTAVRANAAALRLFGPMGLREGVNVLDCYLRPPRGETNVINRDEMVDQLILRLRRELNQMGHDSQRAETLKLLSGAQPNVEPTRNGPRPALSPMQLSTPVGVISLFSTVAHFGQTEDIGASGLRVELHHPADEVSARRLEQAAQAAS